MRSEGLRTVFEWQLAGFAVCLGQSAMFSGANLAFFGVNRIRLEADAAEGDPRAARVLAIRRDPHGLLATILWGNVTVNCALTVLAGSLLGGAGAFVVSTLAIAFLGELLPQAYVSRHALGVASRLAPLVDVYGVLLFPVVRPTAWLLDRLLGPEEVKTWSEGALRRLLHHHMHHPDSEVGPVEGRGAMNFLDIDDLPLHELGTPLETGSVLALPIRRGRPVLPKWSPAPDDPFLQSVAAPGVKWLVLTDPQGEPRLALDAHRFLRGVLFGGPRADLARCFHEPILVRDPATPLGKVLERLRARRRGGGGDLVDQDLILLWGPIRRVVTGADLLGRLTRGIARRDEPHRGARRNPHRRAA